MGHLTTEKIKTFKKNLIPHPMMSNIFFSLLLLLYHKINFYLFYHQHSGAPYMALKMLFNKKSKRDFSFIKNQKEFFYIMKNHLSNKKFFLKKYPNIIVSIQITHQDEALTLQFSRILPHDILQNPQITLFTLKKYHMEMTLEKIAFSDPQSGKFNFLEAKIANDHRSNLRIAPNQPISIKDIQLHRYLMYTNMVKLPICINIAFDHLRQKIIQEIPNILVEPFNSSMLQDKLIESVYKSQKILYISNISDSSSYMHQNHFLDVKQSLGALLPQEKMKLQNQKIKSILIYPVIYHNHTSQEPNQNIFVGYFKITSRNPQIHNSSSKPIFTLLEKFSTHICDYIRHSNTIQFQEEYPILNISTTGIRFSIEDKNEDKNLIDILIANPKNHIFFKVYINPKKRFILHGQLVSIFQETLNTKKLRYIISINIQGSRHKKGTSPGKNMLKAFLMSFS